MKQPNDQTIVVSATSLLDTGYLERLGLSLEEWNSDEDEKAYKNLNGIAGEDEFLDFDSRSRNFTSS
jgi:hypothetical protein